MNINWSYSTVGALRKCERQFAFAKVVAHHGFKNRLRRRAYELKQMKSLTMWSGSVVDYMLETRVIPLLKRKQRINATAIADEAILLARQQFAFSEQQRYRDPKLSKSGVSEVYCILQGHALEQSISQTDLQLAYDTIHQSLLNLPAISMAGTDGSLLEYLHLANVLLPNMTKWSFRVDTAKVSPQIDLVVYDQQFRPAIIDWKVADSQTSDYSRQLIVGGLALYNHRLADAAKKSYGYEDIRLYEVNLLKGIVKQHDFTAARANETIDYIYQTYGDIELLVGDRPYDQINLAEFVLSENDVICQFCPFRTLCVHLLDNNLLYDEEKYFKSLQDWQLAIA